MDTKNVAKCFTQLKVTDSPPRTTNRRLAAAAAKLHFEDFTYNGGEKGRLAEFADQPSKTQQSTQDAGSSRVGDMAHSMIVGSLAGSRLSVRDDDGGLPGDGEEDLGLARYKYDSDDDDPVIGERKSDGMDVLSSSPPTVPVEPKFEAIMTRPLPGQEVEGREVDEAWAAAAGPASYSVVDADPE